MTEMRKRRRKVQNVGRKKGGGFEDQGKERQSKRKQKKIMGKRGKAKAGYKLEQGSKREN